MIAASQAAEKLPEPASTDPVKSSPALAEALARADEIYRDLEPHLTDAERQVMNDAFARLDGDRASLDQLIKDGSACLAGAYI